MLNREKVEVFIKEAMKFNGDKYSQPKRLVQGYSDCSSIIQKALTNLGWNTRPAVAVTTHRMGIEGDARFRQIPMKDLERGDIVWWHKYVNGKYSGHVGVYLGDYKVLEAIYQGVGIHPKSRLAWQRAYRVIALESPANTIIKSTPFKGKGIVKANVLNVRNGNSTNYNVVGKLEKGQEIQLIGKADNWLEINYKGQKAYVSGAYVELVNDKPIENVPIYINGQLIKKGYIIDGVTFINIGGQDKPVRKLFESIGADVRWQQNEVRISL